MIRKTKFSFSDFLGVEQKRLFSSLYNLGAITWTIPLFEEQYDHVDSLFLNSEEQIFIYYSRYYFFHCMAAFLRGHYSSAYANLRNAIDACIHHYNIRNNEYSIEEFVQEKAPYRFAKKIAKKRYESEEGRDQSKLLKRLFAQHEFASSFGSHADPKSFEHRLQKSEGTGQWTFTFIQSREVHENRRDFLKILRAFADALELHLRMHDGDQEIGKAVRLVKIDGLRSNLAKLAEEVEAEANSATKQPS